MSSCSGHWASTPTVGPFTSAGLIAAVCSPCWPVAPDGWRRSTRSWTRLWGDDPPPSAAKTVQSHVVRLRRSLGRLGPSIIETVPGGYRLAIDPEGIDAGWAERLAAEGRELLRAGAPAAAAERFVAALELWRGPAYAEFRDADFAAADGVRLDELHLATQEDLAEAWVAMGSAATAISALERLVRNEPGRERAWGLLMRALYSTGRQHEALGAFQRARQVLAESYGLEPGPDLRSLERRILDQDPSLGSTTGRVALAAALHTSTPLVGRTSELAALDTAWRMAREGAGQLRILSGPIDVGRTRLAADLAGRAIAVGGDVEYVRAADGLDSLAAPTGTGGPMSPGVIVDAVAHRCRRGPMILIIDDMEWAPGPVVTTIAALTSALEGLALLVVLIVDPSGGGPAVAAIGRLDPEQARTLSVGPMSDADIAAIVVADGVEDDAVPPRRGAGGRPTRCGPSRSGSLGRAHRERPPQGGHGVISRRTGRGPAGTGLRARRGGRTGCGARPSGRDAQRHVGRPPAVPGAGELRATRRRAVRRT